MPAVAASIALLLAAQSAPTLPQTRTKVIPMSQTETAPGGPSAPDPEVTEKLTGYRWEPLCADAEGSGGCSRAA